MQVTFFSNFLNHHQLPLCTELFEHSNVDFKFIATEPVPEERLKLGYHNMNDQYPFVINTYNNREDFAKAIILGNDSDVVILGSAPYSFVKKRIKENKFTFIYSERIFKKGRIRILNPKTLASLILKHFRNRNKNLYLLCAGAYTSSDFSLVGAYKNKAYKWGYFPEIKEYDVNTLMRMKLQEVPKLLWVGRLLDWKHPDDVIKLAMVLKENGYIFNIEMIGSGPMEANVIKLININRLQNQIQLMGSMSPEQVRKRMESANIFLFTSDFYEGWGAVLNEAMNSGCGVVASHAIGSVPYLITNGFNGLIYKNKNINHLYDRVKFLLNNMDECQKMGINAYKTITDIWNAKVAAKRLMQLIEDIKKDRMSSSFFDGPCSKAEIITKSGHA